MIIDNIKVEVLEIQNLYEFLKFNYSHFVLKAEINENKAIYYHIIDSSSFVTVRFCVDKNYKNENLKIENGKVCDTREVTGNTIVTVKVREDTFLNLVLDKFFEIEEKQEKAEKKKAKKECK